MKNLIVLFLLFPSIALANNTDNLILGTWIKTKVVLKDGSRFIARNSTYGAGFLKFNFLKGERLKVTSASMIDGNTLDYQIKDNILNIVNSRYHIIKLNQDSLVLEFIDPDIDDSKEKIFYFTKLETYHNEVKPVFNEVIKDDIYTFSDFIFPVSNGAIEDLERRLFSVGGNGELKLAFIITKKGILEDLKILKNDSLSIQTQSDILKAFKMSRVMWKPAVVNGGPVNVSTGMTVKLMTRNHITSSFLSGLKLLKEDSYDSLPLDKLAKADNYMKEALSYARAHEYEKAISSCTKCLEIDDINIDVYYLRATLYFETNNKTAACGDWQKLAQLGQVLGTKYAIKYCSE